MKPDNSVVGKLFEAEFASLLISKSSYNEIIDSSIDELKTFKLTNNMIGSILKNIDEGKDNIDPHIWLVAHIKTLKILVDKYGEKRALSMYYKWLPKFIARLTI
jgi:hypothetical protein